jgi:Zn-finger protein
MRWSQSPNNYNITQMMNNSKRILSNTACFFLPIERYIFLENNRFNMLVNKTSVINCCLLHWVTKKNHVTEIFRSLLGTRINSLQTNKRCIIRCKVHRVTSWAQNLRPWTFSFFLLVDKSKWSFGSTTVSWCKHYETWDKNRIILASPLSPRTFPAPVRKEHLRLI